jgi:2'-5' RNA ligase
MNGHNMPAVEHASQFANHWWWRPGWRPGRRMYTFFLTFEDNLAVAEGLTQLYGPRIDRPGLDVVPPVWLHMTIQGLAFTDQISVEDAKAVADSAKRRCSSLTPLQVDLGPPVVASEGVLLIASRIDELRQLKTSLLQAGSEVLGPTPILQPQPSFTPHVTLAYSNGSGPTDAVALSVASVQSQSTSVTFHAVQLICLSRDTRLYTWTPVSSIPLGNS